MSSPLHYILRRGVLIALGILVVLLAVGSPDQASGQAQEQALVSNMDESKAQDVTLQWDRAQGFRTGDNRDGYVVTSVELDMTVAQNANTNFTVAIHTPDSQGNPGARVVLLTAPDSLATGANKFTPSGRLVLEPATRYFVVVDSSSDNSDVKIAETSSDNEVGAEGWIINNGSRNRTWNTTAWSKHTTVAYQIRVNGVNNVKPRWDSDGFSLINVLAQNQSSRLVLPAATGEGPFTYKLLDTRNNDSEPLPTTLNLPTGLTWDADNRRA